MNKWTDIYEKVDKNMLDKVHVNIDHVNYRISGVIWFKIKRADIWNRIQKKIYHE